MGRKSKVPLDLKLKYLELWSKGETGKREAARKLSIDERTFRSWCLRYKENGPLAFKGTNQNQTYSPKLKLNAVTDYLDGKGSYPVIAVKYGLRSDFQLRQWVKMYNEGKDFTYKMSGGSRMTTSRKTTKEERLKIVKECFESGSNYGEIAIKYNVSYQQVYQWTKKFSELGEAGLEDRRGKRKADQAPRSELEEMRIKLAKLEHELYMTKMERDLLKKLDEIERRDASHK